MFLSLASRTKPIENSLNILGLSTLSQSGRQSGIQSGFQLVRLSGIRKVSDQSHGINPIPLLPRLESHYKNVLFDDLVLLNYVHAEPSKPSITNASKAASTRRRIDPLCAGDGVSSDSILTNTATQIPNNNLSMIDLFSTEIESLETVPKTTHLTGLLYEKYRY